MDITTLREWFDIGKKLLDQARNEEAVDVYSNLIKRMMNLASNEEIQLLLELSYNNRDMFSAKKDTGCKIRTYELGVEDYKLAVEASGILDKNELQHRTAWKNLQIALEELKDLQSATGNNMKSAAKPPKF